MNFKCIFPILAGLTFQAYADRGPLFDQSCGEDKAVSSESKLKQRPNATYVLLGNSVLSRFDTSSQQRVYFYHRTAQGIGTDRLRPLPALPELLPNQVNPNWRNYLLRRNDMRYRAAPLNLEYIASIATEIGHERGDRFNGHVSQRFTPLTAGPHDLIAAFTLDVKSYLYRPISAPEYGDVTIPVGIFCVVHRFFVHDKPTLNELAVHETKLPDGNLQFNASLIGKWADFSEAAITNRPVQIQWFLQTRCSDQGDVCRSGSLNWQPAGTGDRFSTRLSPGRYNLKATLNDGISAVSRNYPIDNSNATIEEPEYPPCEQCHIP